MSVTNSLTATKEAPKSLPKLLEDPQYKQRFEQVLGKRAPQFMSSILSAVSANSNLGKASPVSIIQSAMKAAVLDLPIEANLGFAYLVPYKSEVQFQIVYKGFIQLALRSGQYKKINVMEIREGELKHYDRLSEDIELDFVEDEDERNDLDIIGYAGFFRLVNGFEKTVYWPKAKVEKHAKSYSQTYKNGYGNWADNFDAMAKKTVVKLMLSKWGILSVDIQKAIEADQAVIDEDGSPLYPDNQPDNPIIDASFTEDPEIHDAANNHQQPADEEDIF